MPKTVFVVDDDANTRRFLTVALEENGYEAVTAEDGDEAYKMLQDMTPDLILLDVMMPKKTGFSLFKQLRRKDEFKDIPVIMLTGVAGVLEEDEAQAEGDTFESPFDSIRENLRKGIAKMREEGMIRPERFIDKPIDPEELIEAVQAIIGS
jgi:CheY-like chemotaxis protein